MNWNSFKKMIEGDMKEKCLTGEEDILHIELYFNEVSKAIVEVTEYQDFANGEVKKYITID